MASDVRRRLGRAGVPPGRIFLHHNPTNDAWCRDHGPCFVQRMHEGRTDEAIVDWGYNAWGGKYPPFDADDVIPSRIGEECGIPVFHPGIVMEGGSIDPNGPRHAAHHRIVPAQSQPESRAEPANRSNGTLCEFLGVRKILWLGDGLEGDDTDGHVDDLTRFVDPGTVVTVVEDDPHDRNFEPLRENLARLRTMTDQDGRALRVVTLPMPGPMYQDDQRLPASYANFYIANGVVLLPAYDPATDGVAHATLQSLFPTRRVVLINSIDLVWGLGSFHCVTQQWPALPRTG